MKLTVDPKELARAVALAQIGTNPRSPLRQFEMVRLQTVGDDRIEVAGQSEEKSIVTSCTVDIETPGAVLANPGHLVKRLANLGAETSIELSDFALNLKSGRTCYEMHTMGADEWPELHAPEKQGSELPASLLLELITRGGFCPGDASREAIGCVFLETKAGRLRAVTTDGHRLATYSADFDGDLNTQIGAGSIDLVKRVLSDVDGPVLLSHTDRRLFLSFGDTVFGCTRREHHMPPIEVVIPKIEDGQIAKFKTEELKAAVAAVSVSAAGRNDKNSNALDFRNPPLKLTFGETFRIEGENAELGRAFTELDGCGVDKEVSIGVNGRYVLEALAACGDEVEVAVFGELDPLRFCSGAFDGVVMPQRI